MRAGFRMDEKKRGAMIGVSVWRVFVLVLLLGGAGCSDRACITWTRDEGACPARDDALPFFVPKGCSGAIVSVDSEGEFVVAEDDPIPGDLCCYDVTKTEGNFVSGCPEQPPF